MLKLNRIVLAAAVLALTTSATHAADLPPGGLGGFGSVVTNPEAGNNLLTADVLTGNFALGLFGSSSGSLAGVEGINATSFDTSNFPAFTLNGSNGADAFTFTGGTLVEENSSTAAEGTRYRNFTLNGIVTLGADSNTATLIIGFVQAMNGSLAGPITANISLVTPALVPEPTSVALAGIGLAAAGLFGLRRRLVK